MKKTLKSAFAPLTKNELTNLTFEVTEIIASEFSHPVVKVFTTADLWSIQRQGKTRLQRRFY